MSLDHTNISIPNFNLLLTPWLCLAKPNLIISAIFARHLIFDHLPSLCYIQTALSNPDLSSRDCVRLISAIGSVLSSMSAKDLLSPLESLVQSRVESLQALALTDVSPSTKEQVEKELVVLSSLCHHIYPTLQSGEKHPVSVWVSGCVGVSVCCEGVEVL